MFLLATCGCMEKNMSEESKESEDEPFFRGYRFTDFVVILNEDCPLQSFEHTFELEEFPDNPEKYSATIKTKNGEITGLYPMGEPLIDNSLAGKFVLYKDIKKAIIECCDDEPHDILSNFAEMFNLPELYKLND